MLSSFDWNHFFSSPFGWLSVAVVAGVIGSIASSITSSWRRIREAEQMAALKQNMVERGLSAEDIERILNAGTRRQRDDANKG